MADRQFLVMRHDGYAGPFGIAHVDDFAQVHIRRGQGPFTRRLNGKQVGHPQLRATTLEAVHNELIRAEVGDVLTVRRRGGDIVFRAREVVPAVRQIDTNGNKKADAFWSAVKDRFPKCTFLGAYVCKDIAGTSTMSQHSYGNAVDVGASGMDELHVIANWAVSKADELDIQTVIVDQQVWTRAEHWHAYSGLRHYHVHTDYIPTLSGPCGVKG